MSLKGSSAGKHLAFQFPPEHPSLEPLHPLKFPLDEICPSSVGGALNKRAQVVCLVQAVVLSLCLIAIGPSAPSFWPSQEQAGSTALLHTALGKKTG